MRFERLDLNLLVALSALIELRSVSAAAERLHLSQPAMSGALKRLRDYFRDELLVASGQKMILTPKAEQLAQPVGEALLLIRSRITTPAMFDPATSDRHFVVIASDYTYTILMAPAMARAAALAPGVTFEMVPTDRFAQDRLAKGEADLLISIEILLDPTLPRQPLFSDEHAIICWSHGRFSQGIDEEAFFAASHAIAYFGAERFPAFTETFFAKETPARRIEVRVPSHAALPQAVIGTDRIATVYRRHAEYFARSLPIAILRPPMPMPVITEAAQWHPVRDNDEGMHWLRALLAEEAKTLARGNARA